MGRTQSKAHAPLVGPATVAYLATGEEQVGILGAPIQGKDTLRGQCYGPSDGMCVDQQQLPSGMHTLV
jgi:hypothetical protein